MWINTMVGNAWGSTEPGAAESVIPDSVSAVTILSSGATVRVALGRQRG